MTSPKKLWCSQIEIMGKFLPSINFRSLRYFHHICENYPALSVGDPFFDSVPGRHIFLSILGANTGSNVNATRIGKQGGVCGSIILIVTSTSAASRSYCCWRESFACTFVLILQLRLEFVRWV